MSQENWTKLRIGKDASVRMKPISEEVMKEMPPAGSKTFLEHSIGDVLRRDIRDLFRLKK